MMTMQANSDNLKNPPSLTHEKQSHSDPSFPASVREILPGVAASQAAFRRALPELLKKRPRQWVAYHQDELIGFARSETDLYEECYRRGLTDDTFVVRLIMEELGPDTDYTPLFDV
jgi:hypothetical protein